MKMNHLNRYLPITGLCMAATLSVSALASPKGQSDIIPDITVEMFAPAQHDHVGLGGKGWFVDLAIAFETPLEATGFTDFQLTGGGAHNNVAPFPGVFSPGADDRLPGLIVLVSTTTIGAGSCQNIANLFNLTGVTDIGKDETEIWDTWLVGAPLFGVNTPSRIWVAMASDLNADGIYNDAPNAVPDSDGNGMCDASDLRAFGIASNIAKARFFINP